jgi:hypothetical protein
MTLRLAYVACEFFRADMGLASVRSEHQAFYKRIFLHTISPARAYPSLTKPICLMAIVARYPFLRSSYFERRMLFERDSDRLSPVVNLPAIPFERASVKPVSNEETRATSPSAGPG